jgi:HEAT repeat protein
MRTLLLLLLLALAPLLRAQVAPAATESPEETLARCLNDLRSPQVEVRRRAVLVLGKFAHLPPAVGALQRALRDPDGEIRQSAVVAVVENQLFIQLGGELLPLLADENVHIRRIVSTFLRQALMLSQMGAAGGALIPPPLRPTLANAFRDPDLTVRKNMVTHYPLVQAFVPLDALAPALKDEHRELRALALSQCAEALAGNPEGFAGLAAAMVQDPDPLLRQHLARLLGRGGDRASLRLLRQLAQDADFEVATAARMALLMQGQADVLPALRAALDDRRLKSELAEEIIANCPRADAAGRAMLIALIGHERPTYRVSALRNYGMQFLGDLDFELLWRCLDDPSTPVRTEAARFIMMTPSQKRPADFPQRLTALARHPQPDVRELAVTLAMQTRNDTAAPLLQELLLDDHAGVRGKAIHGLIARRLGDWQEIARISARDELPGIRAATVEALLSSGTPENRALLGEIYRTTADPQLKQQIRAGAGRVGGLPEQM